MGTTTATSTLLRIARTLGHGTTVAVGAMVDDLADRGSTWSRGLDSRPGPLGVLRKGNETSPERRATLNP